MALPYWLYDLIQNLTPEEAEDLMKLFLESD